MKTIAYSEVAMHVELAGKIVFDIKEIKPEKVVSFKTMDEKGNIDDHYEKFPWDWGYHLNFPEVLVLL